ncbi:MAG: peptidoglycan DD-metalloendopeptidase family protein [Caldilineaceae bacterium]
MQTRSDAGQDGLGTMAGVPVPQTVLVEAVPLPVTDDFSDVARPSDNGVIVSRELVSIYRLSQGPNGEPANGPVLDVAMSADGRYVAYTSLANNLVENDDNGVEDVFLFDAVSGGTVLVSANRQGASGNGWSSDPAVSADGRFVAFYSWAGDLTPGDTNAVQDVFLWDLEGVIRRISLSPEGAQTNDRSGDSRYGARPAISADGARIAYHSQATNLVELDTNSSQDVFVYDAGQRNTLRVSVSSAGEQADGDSRDPALSASGDLVVFSSQARNLSPLAGLARTSQVYLHDLESRATTMISAVGGAAGDADSVTPAISGDGQTIVFASHATNLTENDSNAFSDIFVYDVPSSTLQQISMTPGGDATNGDSFAPTISLDGRYVGFASRASNLVKGDTNGATDIFLHDRVTQHTSRVSVAVTGQWTGLEANADSMGPPAVSVGGNLVSYVSQATNLVAGETTRYAEAYVLAREDLPAYTVSGRVRDGKNQPLAGVDVAAGLYRAVSDDNGHYVLHHVTGGTYSVVPGKDETTFVPARRTVSVVGDVEGVDFMVAAEDGDRLSFLSFPLAAESSPSAFVQALRDTDEGGWVDAWFDHDAPDKSKNDVLLLWDGRERKTAEYHSILGCYEGRCYDGHDGTDFPYRDPNPATTAYEPLPVQAAAAGVVASIVDNCGSGNRWCNRGYGNEVILLHDVGYFTRYSHLDSIDSAQHVSAVVDAGDVLGVMGSTGNSYGAHLHFAVHQDDGNGRWDGEGQDLPVDPFGWSEQEPDPWAVATGSVSRWMWNEHPTVELLVFGDRGAMLQDQTGSITVNVPPGALAGQARLRLEPEASVNPPPVEWLSAGQTLRLQLLDWYSPNGDIVGSDELSEASLALPLSVVVKLDDRNIKHLDINRAHVVRWDERREEWESLPTIIAQDTHQVSATSNRLGSFDVQAPLLCPEDVLEPDDEYFAASTVETGQASLLRLFDLENDEDWIRFDAAQGQTTQIRIEEITDGSTLVAEIHDLDGLTVLASAEGTAAEPIRLVWSPPDDGTYFVRVSLAAGSSYGCDATYRIAVE